MTAYGGTYCDRWRDLLPVHALGNPIQDSADLREHLDGCAACRRELLELQEALSLLPHALPRVRPAAGSKERLLQAIGDEVPLSPIIPLAPIRAARARSGTGNPDRSSPAPGPPPRPAGRGRAGLFFLVSASLCATLGTAALYLRERQHTQALRRDLFALSRRLHETSALTREQAARLAEAEQTLGFLRTRSVQLVSLQPPTAEPDDSHQAVGHILWDRDHRAWLFVAFQLPPPPPDKDYQLWFLVKGDKGDQPVSAGLVRTLPGGDLVADIRVPPDLAEISAAALTLEPKGGVEQPTSHPLLLGQI